MSPPPSWFSERSRSLFAGEGQRGQGGVEGVQRLSAVDLLFPLAIVQRIFHAGFFTLLYHLQQPALPNPRLCQSMIPLLLHLYLSLLSTFHCFQHLLSLLTSVFEQMPHCTLSDLFRNVHLDDFSACKKKNWHLYLVFYVYIK